MHNVCDLMRSDDCHYTESGEIGHIFQSVCPCTVLVKMFSKLPGKSHLNFKEVEIFQPIEFLKSIHSRLTCFAV